MTHGGRLAVVIVVTVVVVAAVVGVSVLVLADSDGNSSSELSVPVTTAAPLRPPDPSLVPDASPVGVEPPSGAECAQRVPDDDWEPRPENGPANNSIPPPGYTLPAWDDAGFAPDLDNIVIPRIDGNFTGTTDQIIAWGACKWGFPVDLIRAMAVEESSWRQSHAGDLSWNAQDCVGGATPPCPTSFGLLQLKHTFRPGSWPYSHRHTAFNVDYSLGVLRACYEGWVIYLLDQGYRRGDLVGCVGWHFSGEWKNPAALGYTDRVLGHLEAQRWRDWPG